MRSFVLILSGSLCCAWASWLTTRGVRGLRRYAVNALGLVGIVLVAYGTFLAL
jgi:hypothetical protein